MTFLSRTGVTSVFVAILWVGIGPAPAQAQNDTRQFSAASGAVVNKTMELANNENFEAALTELRALIEKRNLKDFERATIYQMIGQYSYELDHLDDSLQAFENALLHWRGLLPKEVHNLNIVAAQLMIGNGQYLEGAQRLEAHLDYAGESKGQHIELLVQAYVQAEEFNLALPLAEKWLDEANPKARKHYDLLNFLYENLGMQDRKVVPPL